MFFGGVNLVLLQKKVGDKGFFLTIPKILIEQKGWKSGQKFDIRFNERGNAELFEVK